MLQSRAVMTIMSTAIITFSVITTGYGAVEIYQMNSESGVNHLPSLTPMVSNSKTLAIAKPIEGSVVGYLSIPRIDTMIPILEGIDTNVLVDGVGHYSDSALPGMTGNSVLAAHRDTDFKNLGKLRVGDQLTIDTKWGNFIYEVQRFRVVMADDNSVIVPTKDAELTLSTCFPFEYIGDAPMRFIVQATLVSGNAIS